MLMLTGPLYMLNVYDRVLGSRSVETLITQSLLVAFLYGLMGIFDFGRGRVIGRLGARFQARLDHRVFAAYLRASNQSRPPPEEARRALRDLEAVQRLITSPALMAMSDLPWKPFFFLGIFIFHPALGILSLIGGAVLIVVAVANQITTKAAGNRQCGVIPVRSAGCTDPRRKRACPRPRHARRALCPHSGSHADGLFP